MAVLEKGISRRAWFEFLFKVVGSSSVLKACGVNVTENPTQKPTQGVVYEAPPAKATATENKQPLPTPTEVTIGGQGGPFTKEQTEEIESEVMKQRLEQVKRWVNWWAATDNRPFLAEKVGYDYVFDQWNLPTGPQDPDLANKINILVTWVDNNNATRTSYMPVDKINGGHLAEPPGGQVIPPDFGPLDLTDGDPALGMKRVWRGGMWVRVDGKTGEVRQRIANTGNYDWEAAALGVDPQDASRVTDWDRKLMTAQRGQELAALEDKKLLELAPEITTPEGLKLKGSRVIRVPPEFGGSVSVAYDVSKDGENRPVKYWHVDKTKIGDHIVEISEIISGSLAVFPVGLGALPAEGGLGAVADPEKAPIKWENFWKAQLGIRYEGAPEFDLKNNFRQGHRDQGGYEYYKILLGKENPTYEDLKAYWLANDYFMPGKVIDKDGKEIHFATIYYRLPGYPSWGVDEAFDEGFYADGAVVLTYGWKQWQTDPRLAELTRQFEGNPNMSLDLTGKQILGMALCGIGGKKRLVFVAGSHDYNPKVGNISIGDSKGVTEKDLGKGTTYIDAYTVAVLDLYNDMYPESRVYPLWHWEDMGYRDTDETDSMFLTGQR